IVFISSIAAYTGGMVGAHYAASKSGLHGLAYSLACQTAGHGVTVNVVAPALVESDMIPDDPQVRDYLIATSPMGRLGRPEEVGGTWRENTYPGLACDVPSRFYSYSFAPNPDWSGVYASGQEIWDYFRGIADRFGLRPHIRFGEEIVSARWEEGRWILRTAAG